jgi:hypothetical protein
MFITVYELDDIHRTKPKYLNINKVFLMEIVPSAFKELHYLKVHFDTTPVYKSYYISEETYLNIPVGVK